MRHEIKEMPLGVWSRIHGAVQEIHKEDKTRERRRQIGGCKCGNRMASARKRQREGRI